MMHLKKNDLEFILFVAFFLPKVTFWTFFSEKYAREQVEPSCMSYGDPLLLEDEASISRAQLSTLLKADICQEDT